MILLAYSVTVPEYFDTSQIWMTHCFMETIKWLSLLSQLSLSLSLTRVGTLTVSVSSLGKGPHGVKSVKMWGHSSVSERVYMFMRRRQLQMQKMKRAGLSDCYINPPSDFFLTVS